MPSPSQPAVQRAPVRYHVRYRSSFQPDAPPIASQPEAIPKNSIPMPQIAWNAWRRSRHWSSNATANTRARIEVIAGSTMRESTV